MTNMHETDFTQYGGHALMPEDAGKIYKALHAQPLVMANALQEVAGQRLILWAPTDMGKLNAILAELGKVAKEGTYDIDLALAVPYEPLPGCDDVAIIQELWNHTLMLKKWSFLVKATNFFLSPCVVFLHGLLGHCTN